MSNRIELAVAFGRLGFRIFPLLPGSKRPYPKEGWKAICTTDEATIRRWFAERPDMNYAINCDDGHVILDLDQGGPKQKTGIDNFLNAEQAATADFVEDSIFDGTFRVRTPKGGVHLFFNADRGYANSAETLMAGVDVRGPDGYVVGPGCHTVEDTDHNTAEGDYVVEKAVAIADLPDWLRQKLDAAGMVEVRAASATTSAVPLDEPALVEQAKDMLSRRAPAIEGQGGDWHTYNTAVAVRDFGVSEELCLELLFTERLFEPDDEHPEGRAWNDVCEPPWTYEDLRDKVRNAYSYAGRPAGSKANALALDYVAPEDVPADAPPLKEGESYTNVPIMRAEDDPLEKRDEDRIRKALFWAEDFGSINDEYESLFPGWLLADGVNQLLGTRGVGKTVMMMDWACTLATDGVWNGVEAAKDWAVLYLCGEDDKGARLQFKAWCLQHDKTIPEKRFMMTTRVVPDLMDDYQVNLWIKVLQEHFKGRRVAVFLDTWFRAAGAGDQNDNKDMNKAMRNAERLVKALNGCMISSNHPPKGNEDTVYGSTVLESNGVAILQITNVAAAKRLEVTRIKGDGKGNYCTWALEAVELGEWDKNGREMTGVVALYSGGTATIENENEADRRETLRLAIAELIDVALIESRSGLSYGDVANVVLAHAQAHRGTAIGKVFAHFKDVEKVKAELQLLFTVATRVTLTDLSELRIENHKFVIRGRGV